MAAVETPGIPRNRSLERAVQILRSLAEHPAGVSTSSVASRAGLPRPTAARLLATLADAGLAERLPGSDGWVLGYEAARLGRRADPYAVLVRKARPHLVQLSAATGESSVLAVTRLPLDVEIVAQVDAPNLLGVSDWVGRRFGLHASVSGKLAFARLPEDAVPLDGLEAYTPATITDPAALLAELAVVRRRGYAASVDELEVGLAMVGVDVVPARVPEPRFVASVGVMGPSGRIKAPFERELAAIRRCASALADLAW